jgi:hypothetical protein
VHAAVQVDEPELSSCSACRTEEELNHRAMVAHNKWIDLYADAARAQAEREDIPCNFVQEVHKLRNQPLGNVKVVLGDIMGQSGLSDVGKAEAIGSTCKKFKKWSTDWGIEGPSVFTCLSYYAYAPRQPHDCFVLAHTQAPKHIVTSIEAQPHENIQEYKPTDVQTHKHTDKQTRKRTGIEA